MFYFAQHMVRQLTARSSKNRFSSFHLHKSFSTFHCQQLAASVRFWTKSRNTVYGGLETGEAGVFKRAQSIITYNGATIYVASNCDAPLPYSFAALALVRCLLGWLVWLVACLQTKTTPSVSWNRESFPKRLKSFVLCEILRFVRWIGLK